MPFILDPGCLHTAVVWMLSDAWSLYLTQGCQPRLGKLLLLSVHRCEWSLCFCPCTQMCVKPLLPSVYTDVSEAIVFVHVHIHEWSPCFCPCTQMWVCIYVLLLDITEFSSCLLHIFVTAAAMNINFNTHTHTTIIITTTNNNQPNKQNIHNRSAPALKTNRKAILRFRDGTRAATLNCNNRRGWLVRLWFSNWIKIGLLFLSLLLWASL